MEIVKDEQTNVQEVPSFDPTKEYKWSVDTEFVLKGPEFAKVLNALNGALSTPEAQKAVDAFIASQDLQKILAKAVEEGRAIPR